MNINLNLDQLEEIIEMQEQMIQQIQFLLDFMPVPECVNVKFICSKLKLSKAKVYSSPWLMPNFGKSDYPSATKRWKWDSWEKWQSIDEEKRRSQWLSLPARTKEEILNVERNN